MGKKLHPALKLLRQIVAALRENPFTDKASWAALADWGEDYPELCIGEVVHLSAAVGESLHDKAIALKSAYAAISHTRLGVERILNTGFYYDYAEPGYTKPEGFKLIALGNLSAVTGKPKSTKYGVEHVAVDLNPERFCDHLHYIGVYPEDSDEWEVCNNCKRLFRTAPGGTDWEPFYTHTSDGLVCRPCFSNRE